MKGLKSSNLARYLSYIIGAIFILLPFHALLTTWAGFNLGEIDLFRIWKEILIVPVGLAALYIALKDPKLKLWLKSSRLVLLILTYILLHLSLGFLALSKHKVNPEALIYSLLINLRFLIFFLVCLVAAAKSSWLKNNWPKLVLWPAVVVIVFGLLQQFVLQPNFLSHFGYGHKTIPAYHTVDQKSDYLRIQSTLRGPNPLGAYILFIITVLIGLFASAKKRFWQNWVLIILSTVVLFYSYSRSAWLGLGLSIIILGYLLSKKPKIKLIIIETIVGALIIIGSAAVLWNNSSVISTTLFHTDQTSKSPDSSNEVRSEALTSGLKSVIKQPLGAGPGTAGPASFRNSKSPRLSENYYLQVAQEVGLVGLAIFVSINVIVAIELWRSRKQTLSLILFASFVGLIIVNMLSHAWADDTLSLLWWGLAGIALSSVILKQKANVETSKKAKA